MLETVVAVFLAILAMAAVVGISWFVMWACNKEPCLHTFEKFAENDKRIVLVCERCGKVKKVRK